MAGRTVVGANWACVWYANTPFEPVMSCRVCLSAHALRMVACMEGLALVTGMYTMCRNSSYTAHRHAVAKCHTCRLHPHLSISCGCFFGDCVALTSRMHLCPLGLPMTGRTSPAGQGFCFLHKQNTPLMGSVNAAGVAGAHHATHHTHTHLHIHGMQHAGCCCLSGGIRWHWLQDVLGLWRFYFLLPVLSSPLLSCGVGRDR